MTKQQSVCKSGLAVILLQMQSAVCNQSRTITFISMAWFEGISLINMAATQEVIGSEHTIENSLVSREMPKGEKSWIIFHVVD